MLGPGWRAALGAGARRGQYVGLLRLPAVAVAQRCGGGSVPDGLRCRGRFGQVPPSPARGWPGACKGGSAGRVRLGPPHSYSRVFPVIHQWQWERDGKTLLNCELCFCFFLMPYVRPIPSCCHCCFNFPDMVSLNVICCCDLVVLVLLMFGMCPYDVQTCLLMGLVVVQLVVPVFCVVWLLVC